MLIRTAKEWTGLKQVPLRHGTDWQLHNLNMSRFLLYLLEVQEHHA